LVKFPVALLKRLESLRGYVVRKFGDGHAIKFTAHREKIDSFLLPVRSSQSLSLLEPNDLVVFPSSL
jgi:hypothetical protein